MIHKLNQHKSKFALFMLLVAASAIGVILASVRMLRSDSSRYAFLIWNLMLAWIPFLLASLAYTLANARWRILYVVIFFAAGAWLVFFPNAPYILTDFQHLSVVTDGIPVWYDVVLLIWFAWTGLLLGIVSLYLMQEIIARMLGKTASWLFVIAVTGMSSFGIYIGRFLRWNSWDTWNNPLPLAREILNQFRHPIANREAFVFTIIFATLLLFIYVTLVVFGNLAVERQKQQLSLTQETRASSK